MCCSAWNACSVTSNNCARTCNGFMKRKASSLAKTARAAMDAPLLQRCANLDRVAAAAVVQFGPHHGPDRRRDRRAAGLRGQDGREQRSERGAESTLADLNDLCVLLLFFGV